MHAECMLSACCVHIECIPLLGRCVQLLRAKSGGFRVLALSATPGATADKVQEVLTALHAHGMLMAC